jgi:hypothetical protein
MVEKLEALALMQSNMNDFCIIILSRSYVLLEGRHLDLSLESQNSEVGDTLKSIFLLLDVNHLLD